MKIVPMTVIVPGLPGVHEIWPTTVPLVVKVHEYAVFPSIVKDGRPPSIVPLLSNPPGKLPLVQLWLGPGFALARSQRPASEYVSGFALFELREILF